MKPYVFALVLLFTGTAAFAQQPDSAFGPSIVPAPIPQHDSVIVTVILRHQQDKNLAEMRRLLEAQGFWDLFPPKDARILSWHIAMGLGHVIVMELPVNAVRRLNLALENGAWGAYNTEIYLSYDYQSIWESYLQRREEAREDRD